MMFESLISDDDDDDRWDSRWYYTKSLTSVYRVPSLETELKIVDMITSAFFTRMQVCDDLMCARRGCDEFHLKPGTVLRLEGGLRACLLTNFHPVQRNAKWHVAAYLFNNQGELDTRDMKQRVKYFVTSYVRGTEKAKKDYTGEPFYLHDKDFFCDGLLSPVSHALPKSEPSASTRSSSGRKRKKPDTDQYTKTLALEEKKREERRAKARRENAAAKRKEAAERKAEQRRLEKEHNEQIQRLKEELAAAKKEAAHARNRHDNNNNDANDEPRASKKPKKSKSQHVVSPAAVNKKEHAIESPALSPIESPAESPSPPKWIKKKSRRTGMMYWHNPRTKESTYDDPNSTRQRGRHSPHGKQLKQAARAERMEHDESSALWKARYISEKFKHKRYKEATIDAQEKLEWDQIIN